MGDFWAVLTHRWGGSGSAPQWALLKSWGYIWAEFVLCIEVCLGSCVVVARTGRNLCASVLTLSLWSLSRMWWHSLQDTALCLAPLHTAASPSRPGSVSVAGKWFRFPPEPSSTFSCHERKQCPDAVQAVRGAAVEFLCQQYLQWSPQEWLMCLGAVRCRSRSVSVCRRMLSSYTLLPPIACLGLEAVLCSWLIVG